jgi:DNA-binding response OmpR family regulator
MSRPLVLVADDDADIRDLVTLRLQRFGYEVIEAGTGSRALELALERNPDLIVLDVMMPGLTGYEVTSRLREVSETPILLLTASVRDEHEARGLEVGASAYLRKPFESGELERCARSLLGEQEGAPA